MPTIKDIAQKSGFACSTVSYALRNHPRIPEETRVHIKAVADQLGYQRDAHLGQLMSYLQGRGRGRKASVCPLVWLNSTTDPSHWQKTPWAKEFYDSAARRAESLGFALSEFWVCDRKIPASRLDDVLKARGTKGLLVSTPLVDEEWSQWIDWNSYATVVIDDPFGLPQFDRVYADYAANMRVALEQVRSRGYQRPKVWLTEREDYWTAHGYTYECLRQNRLHLDLDVLLPEYMKDITAGRVKAWIERHKPDVVIAPTPTVGLRMRELGYRMPKDIGYVAMYMLNEDHAWSGFSQRHVQQSVIAVDRVAALLESNTIGRQPYPQKIQIEGEWREGTTLQAPVYEPVDFTR
ncbi:MAG: LacI family transcriptional regulator [Verrucomicrobia bacterium]|nr:MAG: LacI family transcriptional regulator [Verrucomicrobiota bacterium]